MQKVRSEIVRQKVSKMLLEGCGTLIQEIQALQLIIRLSLNLSKSDSTTEVCVRLQTLMTFMAFILCRKLEPERQTNQTLASFHFSLM